MPVLSCAYAVMAAKSLPNLSFYMAQNGSGDVQKLLNERVSGIK
jgi:hypothetical protein